MRIDKVTKLITHADCSDGIASAMIIASVLPNIKIEFHQYNTKALNELEADKNMLFCDFSPPKNRIKDFIKSEAIILDHHKHAKDIVDAFGDNGIFGGPKESGATLAYKYVYEPLTNNSELNVSVKSFADLIAIRDTWQKDSTFWLKSCENSLAIKSLNTNSLIKRSIQFKYPFIKEEESYLGKELFRIRKEKVANVRYLHTVCAGTSVAIFNDPEGLVSDVAEHLREKVDICVGFHYNTQENPSIIYSLRSNVIDVGKICKDNGGGGHIKAAGFKSTNLKDPFLTIEKVLYKALKTNSLKNNIKRLLSNWRLI